VQNQAEVNELAGRHGKNNTGITAVAQGMSCRKGYFSSLAITAGGRKSLPSRAEK